MELSEIKGVGEKTVGKLNKLGIYTVTDLCKFLPNNYLDMSKISDIDEIIEGEYSLIKVQCLECWELRSKSNLRYVKAICDSNGSRVEILWFNMPYIAKVFTQSEWLIWGKFTVEKGIITIINPSYATVENKFKLHGVMPIYPLKGLIGETTFRKILENALSYNLFSSAIPNKYNLNSIYRNVHFPNSISQVLSTHYELATYNIVLDLISYKLSRPKQKVDCQISCEINKEILSKLPFKLTCSQTEALNQVILDINSSLPMNRLILGDVGSGKTIVALLAMFAVAQSGKQAVLMCPTEILCLQHYNNAKKLFGVDNIALLMGSMPSEQKKSIKNSIYCGKSKMIFATQSCISEKLEYDDLGLIVIDESHKFGVSQKGKLENKGYGVNTLIMSATPLPRSLAMTMYDDLQISVIEKRTENLNNIKSYIFNSSKLEKMYSYIAEKAKRGEKVYLICPRLNDGDGKEIFAVKGVYKHITENYLSVDLVETLYGGIKDNKRDEIMNSFTNGKINLLIATTVVEVGVDVPNANTMVILASDCFGLAGLHQLRGRIGRNGGSAECFFHVRSQKIPPRIKAIKEINDGLKLAEIDAEERGYGDVVGNNQSGKNKYEKFLCKVTLEMIKKAKRIADEIDVSQVVLDDSDNDIKENFCNVVLN